jgi:hypothetical protein
MLAIRPEAVQIVPPDKVAGGKHPSNVISAHVDWIEFLGGKCLLTLTPSSDRSVKINAEIPARALHDLALDVDSRVGMVLPSDAFRVFAA